MKKYLMVLILALAGFGIYATTTTTPNSKASFNVAIANASTGVVANVNLGGGLQVGAGDSLSTGYYLAASGYINSKACNVTNCILTPTSAGGIFRLYDGGSPGTGTLKLECGVGTAAESKLIPIPLRFSKDIYVDLPAGGGWVYIYYKE